MRPHQREAAPDDAENQFVDEGIFGAAQGPHVEPRSSQERVRIDAPAVRGIEHDGTVAAGRLENFEGRVELVFGVMHGMGMPQSGGSHPGYPSCFLASNMPLIGLLSMGECRAVAKAFARVHPLFTR